MSFSVQKFYGKSKTYSVGFTRAKQNQHTYTKESGLKEILKKVKHDRNDLFLCQHKKLTKKIEKKKN